MRSPSPSLAPLPHHPACSCAPIWPPNLDRYLLLSSSYRLPHGCVVPRAHRIGISMIHIPPLPHQPSSFKYTSLSLGWISLVKLCKHRKKGAHLSLLRTLCHSLARAPCHSFNLRLVKCYPRLVTQGHNPKNCTQLSISFIHPTSSSFGQELYKSSVLSLGQMGGSMVFLIRHSNRLVFFRSPTSFTP